MIEKSHLAGNPPRIQHSEPRPQHYRAMIRDAAKNIHLRQQSTDLILCYASHADNFRPALKLITAQTGIPENKVSEIRKRLVSHGLIAYDHQGEIIRIDWHRIRAFALLEKPLRLPRGKRYFFAPVRQVHHTEKTLAQLGRKYRIRNPRKLTDTEKHFYSRLEEMTEKEFQEALHWIPDRLAS